MAKKKKKYDTPWNPEHLEVVKAGADAIDEWRGNNMKQKFELRGADLSGNVLDEANLSEANLSDANLRNAVLQDASLYNANLSNANLTNANISRADMRYAVLRGADLRKAYLSHANLSGAKLKDAGFSQAIFGSVILGDIDLSGAKGLDTIFHQQPSTIGIDTLYRSGGKIPEVFLRGCAVPEDMITYIPSLIGTGIEFYSSFISYSHKDEEFTLRLHSRMQQEKLRVWYAPEDIRGGRKTHHQIDEAIRVYDKLLLVLSEKSMASEWVKTELRWASREEKRTGKQKLFPIRLVSFDTIRKWKCFDAEIGKDLAVEVREYNIPDFTNWKDQDSFESEFKKLLRDLRGDSPRETAEDS